MFAIPCKLSSNQMSIYYRYLIWYNSRADLYIFSWGGVGGLAKRLENFNANLAHNHSPSQVKNFEK